MEGLLFRDPKIRDRPAGAAAALLLFLLPLLLPARLQAVEPACASAVRFEVTPEASLPSGLKGRLVLRPGQGGGEPLRVEAQVGTAITQPLPCGSKWEVTAEFADAWAPRAAVVAGGAGGTVTSRIGLWPLGRITGTVKLAGSTGHLPKVLSVATLAPRSQARRDTPQGLLDCPVAADGRWRCPPLPATTFDLSLSAEGFIPQYRWDLQVAAGKSTDLGAVELKPGASVAGYVEVEGGTIDPGCRVRLLPLTGPGSGAKTLEKVRRTATEARVRKDGFFQLAGIGAGQYSLAAEQQGFTSNSISPLKVEPRSRIFLRQTLTLQRPLQVELSLSPPLDWLDHPWRIQVFRSSGESARLDETVFDGVAGEQGTVTLPRQKPGRFDVHVFDSLGNRLATRTLEVTGPADSQQTIPLKFLTAHGRLRYGREPIAATLWFGGRYGSSSIKMESDAEGRFHGVLPSDGGWTVEIAAAEPKLESRVKVKVTRDDQDRLQVDIDLPATRVFGKAVDEEGHPLPKAVFSVSTDNVNLASTADDTGSFDVRGLSEGMAYAGATFSSADGDWSSDRIPLFLHDGEDVGPLAVRLRKHVKLSGQVRSVRGPVAGAGISAVALRPVVQFADSVRTEPDGTFTAQVPAAAEAIDVVVSSPGYGLKAFPVAVGGAPPPPLVVDEESGSLEIVFPPPAADSQLKATSLWVFQNSLPLLPDTLHQWALGHGQEPARERGSGKGPTWTLPELAPGDYRVCLVDQSLLVSWELSGWTSPAVACSAGQLTAGGSLQLDLTRPGT